MKLINGELVATSAELVAAPAVLDLTTGPLTRMPRVRSNERDSAAVRAFFNEARPEIGALYKDMLATLAAPVRIGTLHYALGEEALTRMILAWGPETGENAVVMIHRGNETGWAIARSEATALTNLVSSVMLGDVPLKPNGLHAALSQDSVLVFLAVLHLLRHGRLNALIAHEPSPVGFNAAAIPEAMEDTVAEDYRWPLLFFDKVLPLSLSGLAWAKNTGPALKELADRGLVEKVARTKDTWALTPLGYQVAVADAQHLTKAGLRITQSVEESLKAHETFLLMRSMQDIFMIDLGGKEGVIASVSLENLETLIKTVLTPPAALLAGSAPAAAPEPDTCVKCGQALAPGAKFCPSCGHKVGAAATKATCTSCGAPLAPGAKFCAKCGAPV